MKRIVHNKPTLDNKESSALKNVIKSNWVIGNSEVEKLEKTIAKMHNLKYAIAVNSGTAAIHLSLLALGIKKDDEVILPSYTTSDPLNAINYTGATPVITDVKKNSFSMNLTQVKRKINKRTKAIIVPHMLGSIVKIDELEKLGVSIINDCAQSFGGIYKGKQIGSFGNLTIFSFYATKIITTGQGGMIATNNKKYYEFIKDIIDYNGRKNYKIRFNYPLTDLSASLGNIQIKKLEKFLKMRRQIGYKYQKTLENKNILFWPKKGNFDSNYYRFILKFENEKERDRTKKIFGKNMISAIIPINNYELLHNCLGMNKMDFPNAEDLAATCLSIPIYPSLKTEEKKRIIYVLKTL